MADTAKPVPIPQMKKNNNNEGPQQPLFVRGIKTLDQVMQHLPDYADVRSKFIKAGTDLTGKDNAVHEAADTVSFLRNPIKAAKKEGMDWVKKQFMNSSESKSGSSEPDLAAKHAKEQSTLDKMQDGDAASQEALMKSKAPELKQAIDKVVKGDPEDEATATDAKTPTPKPGSSANPEDKEEQAQAVQDSITKDLKESMEQSQDQVQQALQDQQNTETVNQQQTTQKTQSQEQAPGQPSSGPGAGTDPAASEGLGAGADVAATTEVPSIVMVAAM